MPKDPYKRAKKRVKEKKEFYGHLTAYICTNVAMFIVVMFSGGGVSWFYPAVFWGMGLAIHYFGTFGLPRIGAFDSKEWEEKEIRKELRKQGYEVNEDELHYDDELELREIKRAPRKFNEDDFV